jgi:hypothetical protein
LHTLTWEELLSSLDVSELAQSQIPLTREACHALRPGNFLRAGWNRFNGGGGLFSFSTPASTSVDPGNGISTASSTTKPIIVSIGQSNSTATSKGDSSSHTLKTLTAIEYSSSNTLKNSTAIDALNNQRTSVDYTNSTATSKRDSSSDTLENLTASDTLNNLKNSKRLKTSHVRFTAALVTEPTKYLDKVPKSIEGTIRKRPDSGEGTARQSGSQNDEAPKKRVKKESDVEVVSSGHSETPKTIDVGRECIEKIEREKKAAKRDGALPPYELWSGHLLES